MLASLTHQQCTMDLACISLMTNSVKHVDVWCSVCSDLLPIFFLGYLFPIIVALRQLFIYVMWLLVLWGIVACKYFLPVCGSFVFPTVVESSLWSRALEWWREQGFSALCVHVGGSGEYKCPILPKPFLERLPSSCLCLYQKLNYYIRGGGLLDSVFPY